MGVELRELRVDGGMTSNDLLMQMQADILGTRVVRPGNIETTVMGAASAAGMGAGLLDAPLSLGTPTTWEDTANAATREVLVAAWEDAVRRSYNLA